jgi:hypothetical protein
MDEKRLLIALFGLAVALVVAFIGYQFIAPLTVAVFLYYSTRRLFHRLDRFRLPARVRAVLSLSLIGIPETLEGTQSAEAGAYKIKVTGRMSRKVDTDKLQEVALANGIFDHLQSLFRWKAEINASQWKIADASITEPLTEAITTKPGRPAFQITREGE